jgi:hypothetical protein
LVPKHPWEDFGEFISDQLSQLVKEQDRCVPIDTRQLGCRTSWNTRNKMPKQILLNT